MGQVQQWRERGCRCSRTSLLNPPGARAHLLAHMIIDVWAWFGNHKTLHICEGCSHLMVTALNLALLPARWTTRSLSSSSSPLYFSACSVSLRAHTHLWAGISHRAKNSLGQGRETSRAELRDLGAGTLTSAFILPALGPAPSASGPTLPTSIWRCPWTSGALLFDCQGHHSVP